MAGDGVKATSSNGPTAVLCPRCGASLTVRARGQSMAAVCGSCGAVADIASTATRLLCAQSELSKHTPPIAIGTRGTLRGEKWEVIGYLCRSDALGTSEWDELLLWNPYMGFRWLHHYNGHWTFLTPIKAKLGSGREYEGREYQLYDRGSARVKAVHGEAYWRVRVNDTVKTADYISPPYLLSKEASPDEVNWTHGEYIDPAEIAEAFKLARPTTQWGVAPNQPSPFPAIYGPAVARLSVAFCVLVFISLFFSGEDRELEFGKVAFGSSATGVTWQSQPFRVADDSGNISLLISTDNTFTNSWADFDAVLVRDSGEEVMAAAHEISYYTGKDSDGLWSEGSRTGGMIFPAVGNGTYRMEVEAHLAPGAPAQPTYLRVVRGHVASGNLFLALGGLLLVFPLLWARSHSFEVKRWSNSDYSPYVDSEE